MFTIVPIYYNSDDMCNDILLVMPLFFILKGSSNKEVKANNILTYECPFRKSELLTSVRPTPPNQLVVSHPS